MPGGVTNHQLRRACEELRDELTGPPPAAVPLVFAASLEVIARNPDLLTQLVNKINGVPRDGA